MKNTVPCPNNGKCGSMNHLPDSASYQECLALSASSATQSSLGTQKQAPPTSPSVVSDREREEMEQEWFAETFEDTPDCFFEADLKKRTNFMDKGYYAVSIASDEWRKEPVYAKLREVQDGAGQEVLEQFNADGHVSTDKEIHQALNTLAESTLLTVSEIARTASSEIDDNEKYVHLMRRNGGHSVFNGIDNTQDEDNYRSYLDVPCALHAPNYIMNCPNCGDIEVTSGMGANPLFSEDFNRTQGRDGYIFSYENSNGAKVATKQDVAGMARLDTMLRSLHEGVYDEDGRYFDGEESHDISGNELLKRYALLNQTLDESSNRKEDWSRARLLSYARQIARFQFEVVDELLDLQARGREIKAKKG